MRYETPQIRVILFSAVDIVATSSGGDSGGGNTGGGSSKPPYYPGGDPGKLPWDLFP